MYKYIFIYQCHAFKSQNKKKQDKEINVNFCQFIERNIKCISVGILRKNDHFVFVGGTTKSGSLVNSGRCLSGQSRSGESRVVGQNFGGEFELHGKSGSSAFLTTLETDLIGRGILGPRRLSRRCRLRGQAFRSVMASMPGRMRGLLKRWMDAAGTRRDRTVGFVDDFYIFARNGRVRLAIVRRTDRHYGSLSFRVGSALNGNSLLDSLIPALKNIS